MRKILIGWIICSLLGVLVTYFLMQQLKNHEPYTAENIEWSRSDQTARLEKQKFYVYVIFFFLGAEILGFVTLLIHSMKEKSKIKNG